MSPEECVRSCRSVMDVVAAGSEGSHLRIGSSSESRFSWASSRIAAAVNCLVSAHQAIDRVAPIGVGVALRTTEQQQHKQADKSGHATHLRSVSLWSMIPGRWASPDRIGTVAVCRVPVEWIRAMRPSVSS